MAKTTPAAARQPIPEPKGGWPLDKFHGQFGTFVRDPFTGQRFPADKATAQTFGMKWPPAEGSDHEQALSNSEAVAKAAADAAAQPAAVAPSEPLEQPGTAS